jgi:CDP-2,3-bis-(O-geranylgeranyl)-sn-glycerol synthase
MTGSTEITFGALAAVLWFYVPAYAANMSPVLVRGRFGLLAVPLDAGRTLGGKRVLGDHKTWRGLLAAALTGALVFELQRLLYVCGIATSLAAIDYGAQPWGAGVLLGLGAMVGDAVKSFFKRRIGIAPGASWPVFDQIDFLLGAYLLALPIYAPPAAVVAVCIPLVVAGAVVTTAVGYGLGLKEAWI